MGSSSFGLGSWMSEQPNILLHITSPWEKSGLEKSLEKTVGRQNKQAEMFEQGSVREQETEYLGSCILTCYCSAVNRIEYKRRMTIDMLGRIIYGF